MASDTTPILIGVGQITQREVDPREALDPMQMMTEAAKRAVEDAQAGPALLANIDRIAVVRSLSIAEPNPGAALGASLGIAPKETSYSKVGGNTPQMLVNEFAELIAVGQVNMALLAGVEVLDTLTRAAKQGIELPFRMAPLGPEDRDGSTPQELEHGLYFPINTYPLFENAWAHAKGLSAEAHRDYLGQLFAPFSQVAAGNPHAWFPLARTPQEIAEPGPGNRLVGYPYTKRMNAIIQVNQAAALILTSVGVARTLQVHPSRWIYLHGAADAHDHWYVSERVNYHSSPAIRAVGREALRMADLTIDDIAYFDLYSCFPVAVSIARDELGIPAEDPRPLTVTGGLPYFGGPGNNYVMHSIASMVETLRANPGKYGMVTANGWYVTKHAAGIYSTQAPLRDFKRTLPAIVQTTVDADPKPAVSLEPQGRATIETFTVAHGQDGAPNLGIVIGRLPDGARFVANTPAERTILEGLMKGGAIGSTGRVRTDGRRNLFEPG